MKLYVLKAGIGYDGYEIGGVFSSKESAQELLDRLSIDINMHINYFTIDEYELRFINGDFSLTSCT